MPPFGVKRGKKVHQTMFGSSFSYSFIHSFINHMVIVRPSAKCWGDVCEYNLFQAAHRPLDILASSVKCKRWFDHWRRCGVVPGEVSIDQGRVQCGKISLEVARWLGSNTKADHHGTMFRRAAFFSHWFHLLIFLPPFSISYAGPALLAYSHC